MAYGGSITARLILDTTGFFAGLLKARQELTLLGATVNRNAMTPISNLTKEFDRNSDSAKKAGAAAGTARSSFNLLGSVMGMVKQAGSFLASMLLFELINGLSKTIDHTMKAQQEMLGLFKTVTYGANNLKYTTQEIKGLTQALDAMGNKYRKINKYMIGEIVADVAVQGGLSPKETEKLIEPATLVYEMFRRGGRTPEMAKIAIREISEGEIRRLTLETGVGKTELMQAGWSGDTNDKVGMFEALLKVAKDRNWDKFALKLYTLDDVTQLLTNSISYLAVGLGNLLLPAVVLVFNAVNDLITAMGNLWNALPGGAQLAIIGGALVVFAFAVKGYVIKALLDLSATIMTKVIPAVVQFGVALLANPVFWVAIAIVALIAVIYEVGKAWGWWTDLASFGQAIWANLVNLFNSISNALTGLWNALGGGGQLALIVGLITTIGVIIYTYILPALVPLVSGVIPALMAGLSTIGTFITATLIPAIVSMGMALLTNPITWIALIIMGVAYALFEAGKAWGWWTDLASMGSAIFGNLQRIFTALGDALHGQNAKVKELGSGWLAFVQIFQYLWIGVSELIGWFNGLMNAIYGVQSSGDVLTDTWNRLMVIFNAFMGVINALKGAWDTFVGSFFDDQGKWVGLIPGLQNAFGALWDWLSNIDWGALLAGMIDALKGMGQRIWTYLFGGEGPSIQERIMEWFSSVDWSGVAQWLMDRFAELNPITLLTTLFFGEDAGKAVSDGFKNILGAIAGGITWLVGAIGNTLGAIKSVGEAIWAAIFGDADGNNAIDWIINWVTSIDWAGILSSIVETIIQLIGHYNPITLLTVLLFGEEAGAAVQEQVITFLWTLVEVFIEGLTFFYESVMWWISTFQLLWDTLWLYLEAGWTLVWTTLTTIWNAIVTTAYAIWNPIYSFFLWVWNGIMSVAQHVWNNIFMVIYKALSSAWNTVVSIGSQIWSAISNTMTKIWGVVSPYVNMIINAWNTMKDKLVGAANTIRDKVWGPISSLWDKLKGFWNWITNPFGGGSGGAGSGRRAGSGAGLPGAGPATGTGKTAPRSKGGAGGFFSGIMDNAFSMVESVTGINPGAGPSTAGSDKDLAEEYFECTTQKGCQSKGYGAGWDISKNWIDKALDLIYKWSVDIGGVSFSLSTLSKGGSMELFRAIAGKLIGGTRYQFYYGDKKSNAQALKDRAFNCYDGAQILVSLANALGLSGRLVNGFWGSTPHTWASINGVAFDTTAFQHGYGWRGPAQRGAGFSEPSPPGGTTIVQIEVPINGTVYDEKGLLLKIKRAVKDGLNEVADNLF